MLHFNLVNLLLTFKISGIYGLIVVYLNLILNFSFTKITLLISYVLYTNNCFYRFTEHLIVSYERATAYGQGAHPAVPEGQ